MILLYFHHSQDLAILKIQYTSIFPTLQINIDSERFNIRKHFLYELIFQPFSEQEILARYYLHHIALTIKLFQSL